MEGAIALNAATSNGFIQKAALVGGLLLTCALFACGGGGSDKGARSLPTAESVRSLESFHYVASLSINEKRPGLSGKHVSVSTEGDFQQPDRHAFTYTTTFGESAIARSAVLIGSEAWVRDGDAPWRSVAADDPDLVNLVSSAFTSIRPNFLGGPEFDQALGSIQRLPSTEDNVNGVVADHYVVGQEGQAFFRSFLSNEQFLQNVEDLSWELWLARDGSWPVRLLATATITGDNALGTALGLLPPTGWELRIDISRPNDPTLSVTAPQ